MKRLHERQKETSTPRNARIASLLAPSLAPHQNKRPSHRNTLSYGQSPLSATLTRTSQTPKMSIGSRRLSPRAAHISPGLPRRSSPRNDIRLAVRPTPPKYTPPRSSSIHRRALSLPISNESPHGIAPHSARKGAAGLKRIKYPYPVKAFGHSSHVGYSPGNPNKVNQDNFIEIAGFSGQPSVYLFGVCDGHGTFGKEVSMYAKQRLPVLLGMDPALTTTPKNCLTYSIIQVNEELTNSSLDVDFSGSTLIVVLLFGKSLWCANVGDSRAVLARLTRDSTPQKRGQPGKTWMSLPLSRDHKPDEEDESLRISSCGGRIASYQDEAGNALGPARVWLKDQDIPGLAMSRSLGDLVASTAGVICIPEIMDLTLKPEHKFIVIGSDGLFEFISNEEVVSIVVPFWTKNDMAGACAALEAEARARWTQEEEVIDDITCVVIFLDVN